MNMTINGKERQFDEVETMTIKELLTLLEKDKNWLAVAVDKNVIPRSCFESFLLSSGQEIEILTPMQGG